MAAKLILGEEDGFIEITTGPAEAPALVRLDLYRASTVYSALYDAHPEPAAFNDAWTEWLGTQGLAGLSHRRAGLVADAVFEQVEALKKKDGVSGEGSPASPGISPAPTSDSPSPDPSAT